ncbi:NUDIX hydrolase [Rhodohalobacter sp. 614A]|uniref:NUDIX hydrolase n=1 Tax=Rhodohalobacter sp. 614A TaxID=2908649 RepID=UPI001F4855D6|nr:NUDIX domain-containing protein [Rhodohalobacter sp. 614A]
MGQQELKKPTEDFWDKYQPGLAIDCVIVGYHERELKILIMEYENTDLYALPAGFIEKNEDLDTAASRALYERTGLKDIYLSQFHTFGKSDRNDTEAMEIIMRSNGLDFDKDHWLLRRFVSVGYVALVDYKKVKPTAGFLSSQCSWCDLDSIPPLIQDHQKIIDKAILYLRDHVDDKLLGANLLVDTFTMKDLQKLHETILGEKLHRTGFHRKMMDSGHLERLGKKKTGKAHRSPYLYRFSSDKE